MTYSARCLNKKRNALKDNKLRAENLKIDVKFLENENKTKEDDLLFVVDTVLTPLIRDNSANHYFIDLSPNEVLQFHQNLGAQKQNIIDEMEREMQMDRVFIEKERNLQEANADLEIATYNKDHRKEMAKKLEVSETTLGTRHSRTKMTQETCFYDHQATRHDYELRAHGRTASLLNDFLEHFTPSVRSILNNPPEGFMEMIEKNGQLIQLNQLRDRFLNQE